MLGQVHGDQLFRDQRKHDVRHNQHHHGDDPLHAQAVAHALVILCACKLGGKYARTRKAAEYAQVEDKQELIDNCHCGHLERADTPNHHVIQQADDIGNGILNDQWHHDADDARDGNSAL